MTSVGPLVPKGIHPDKIIDIQMITIQVKNTLRTLFSAFAIALLIVNKSFDTIIADKIDDIGKITDVCYHEINMKRRSLCNISLQHDDEIVATILCIWKIVATGRKTD